MPSELRPDHADRPVRFEYQNEERDDLREMFAVHTHEEVQAVIDRIEAKDRGKPLGEQMLADAHRRGDESDRPNIAINLRSDLTAQPRLAAGLVQHYNCIQATSQERQAMATAEQISDPILGEGAIDKSATLACFKKHFGPTEQTVLVLTCVNNGMVPKAQRALYQELEDWYTRSSSKVLLKMLGAMQFSTTANLTAARAARLTHKIEDHLQLHVINLRMSDHSDAKCVLHYKTDLDYCDWYVRIYKNYRILRGFSPFLVACAPCD